MNDDICMFYRYGRCVALTVEHCNNPKKCSFFKTQKQYDEECKRCEERLRRLNLVYDDDGLKYIGG